MITIECYSGNALGMLVN